MVFNLIYKRKNVLNVNNLKVIILTFHYLESHVLFLTGFHLIWLVPFLSAGIIITANAEEAQAT